MTSTRRRDLLILCALTAVIGLYGIWRVYPHYAFFDSVGAIKDALLLLDRGFIKAMQKGGNAHLWLVNLGTVIALPWWLLTDQAALVFNWPGLGSVIHDPAYNQVRNQVLIIGRIMSVTAAVVTVGVTYLVANRLYARRAGWLAALITLLSMGFITTAKMATEDVPMTAALMGTVYLCVLAVERADRRLLAYAAVVLGLAGSLKAPAVMAVPMFTVAAYWVLGDTGATRRTGPLYYAAYGYAAFMAYVVTTPSMLRYPIYWLNQMLDYTTASVGGSTYTFQDPRAVMALAQLAVVMSLPLFLVAVVASLYGVVAESQATLRAVRARTHLTTDQRARWLFVLLTAAVAFFVGALTSPQYFRVVPLVPLLAVMTAGVVTRINRHAVRRVAHVGLAVALMFAAIYTGTAVASWNTVRDDAEAGVDALPENASVASLAQELYLPRMPEHVQFRKYRDNVKQNRNRSAALEQYANYCADYLIIAHNHYHRFYRDATVFPETAAVMKTVVSNDGYRQVDHSGPPIAQRNDAVFWFRESLTLHHYANSVGNSPITILEPTRNAREVCANRPDLYTR